jgi:alpha-1,3-rhamnosyl/mannosyltransferase
VVIGADATCWANSRGYGRFTRELLQAMVELASCDTFVLFADDETAQGIDLHGPNVKIVPVNVGVPPAQAASVDGRRSLADMLRLTRAVAREGLDVFFTPSVYSYFPLPPRLRSVVCIHDAIAERFPELTLPTARARLFWRLKVALAVRQSRLILTISHHAGAEIAEALHLEPSRIRIVGAAPAESFRPSEARQDIEAAAARLGLPSGATWFLYVGGFNPHKNVDVLVRAHGMLVADGRSDPPHLLLVGPVEQDVFHTDHERIRQAITEAGTRSLVRWLGFVADDELRHLHSGALALVLPSQSEGFGLPAVEAAACGTPAIATTESPLPDLLAGGGLFVEPRDPSALKEALARMLGEDERREMGSVALERARDLTWERSARLTLDALYEAAA